jgi:hypothetical protein
VERIADDFSYWLRSSCENARRSYSKRAWQEVVQGPKPFTQSELEVIEARKQFRWRVIGHTSEGNLLFEVTNGSKQTLPFLSLGVQGEGGTKLLGGVHLRVGSIAPGTTAVIEQDCYRDKLSPDQVEVFDFPDPIPEKRERYWELRKPT